MFVVGATNGGWADGTDLLRTLSAQAVSSASSLTPDAHASARPGPAGEALWSDLRSRLNANIHVIERPGGPQVIYGRCAAVMRDSTCAACLVASSESGVYG